MCMSKMLIFIHLFFGMGNQKFLHPRGPDSPESGPGNATGRYPLEKLEKCFQCDFREGVRMFLLQCVGAQSRVVFAF